MMFKIALRNIFRRKRRSIITILTMLVGFMLAAVSIAWSDGTYNNIINLFTRNRLGQIQIHGKGYLDNPTLYNTIDNYDSIMHVVAQVKGVEYQTPRLYAAGLASYGDQSAGAEIIGIDPVLAENAINMQKKVVEGKYFSDQPGHKALLGKKLASILKAQPGDSVIIISQGADGSLANDIYKVIGLVESGDPDQDRVAFYLHLADAQELLVLPNQVHEIAIICNKLAEVPQIAVSIREKLNNPNLDVATWQKVAKSFYRSMQLDKDSMWVMLLIIIFMVAVAVLNTVLMSVLERTREYGVLRALGTAPGEVFRLVVIEVLIMAAVGVIIGCGFAYLINSALSVQGIPMPETLSYGGVDFTRMYTEINARSFYLPAISVLFSAFIVSIFPALKAARIAPAKAMRTV
jgi:putative ABC transport system permease protein